MSKWKWLFRSIQVMTLLGLAGASVIVLATLVVPLAWNSWQSQQDLKIIREEINGLAQRVDSLQSMQNDNLEANLEVLLATLPEKFDAAQVVSAIKQVAQEQQVEISEVSVVVEENDSVSRQRNGVNNVVEIQALQVGIRSPIANIIKFLDGLDQSLPLMQVTQLSSQTVGGEQAGEVMNATMLTSLKVDSYAWSMPKKTSQTEDVELMTFDAEDQRLLEGLMLRKRYALIPATNSGELERKNPFEL